MVRRRSHRDQAEVIRRTAIVIALALFIYASSIATPTELVRTAGSMVGSAAIGLSAGVESNPYNTAAAQLSQKQAELDQREANVRAYEGGSLASTRMLAAAAFLTSILVLLLVAGNYYMDWRRYRRVA